MSGWVTGGLVVGGLLSGGASIYSSSSAAGATKRAAASAFRNRPFESSDPLQQLYAQSAYGLGSDPDQLVLDLMSQQLGAGNRESLARGLEQHFGEWKALASQDMSKLSPQKREAIQAQIAQHQRFVEKMLREQGMGTVEIIDGIPRLVSSDPGIRQIVEAARVNGATIRAQRLAAEANLAKIAGDFPSASAAEIDALTKSVRESQDREINQRMQEQADQILQQANLRGYNPAGILGELEKNRADSLFDTQFTSADRALQILTGRQTGAMGSVAGINAALSPERFLSILQAQRGAQPTDGSSVGQLAAAQAQAAQLRGQGISQAGSSLSDALTMAGLLGMNSSQKASKGPGSGDGPYSESDWFKAFGMV